jgi:hypothetical protein
MDDHRVPKIRNTHEILIWSGLTRIFSPALDRQREVQLLFATHIKGFDWRGQEELLRPRDRKERLFNRVSLAELAVLTLSSLVFVISLLYCQMGD